MKRFNQLRMILAFSGLLVMGVGFLDAAPKPNVLFLAVDDMRDWIGCLDGYKGRVHTPNIDRLADEGMLFTNAHCVSPLCGPSRAAIMTGLRPSTTGLYGNGHWWFPNRPETTTLPLQFGKNGYRVVGSGKLFHHTAGNNPPRQWDAYHRLTFQNDPWFRGAKLNYPWSRHTPFPKGFPFSGIKGLPHENDWGVLPIPDADQDDALSADFTIRFLKEMQKPEKPFFLACGLFRPHLPWYVPRKYFDLYPLKDIRVPEAPDDDLDDIPPAGQKMAKSRRSDLQAIRKAGKTREAIQAYLASISFTDAQLGRILATLRRSPHAGNTITILWSDHGWHHGEKQHWHKSTLWEAATRVPFIIRSPGHKPGTSHRPVSLIDIYPTLNELCNIEPSGKLDGKSLAPLLLDPKTKWDRPAIIEYQQGNAAVRTERWRYIRYKDGGEELYDHDNDPEEWDNIAGKSQHSELKMQLAQWLPKKWAPSASTKSAFNFNHTNYSWTHRKTGRVFNGQK
jgi:arylsulfatase A-like enzyme